MTPKDKKEFVIKQLQKAEEKRSYNEIMADLELQLWRERIKGGY